MIYVEMYGRLGNQFFRYAVARCLQLKYYQSETLVLNFSQIDKISEEDSSFYNVLNDYNVANFSIYPKKGSVIFNESSLFQKFISAVYYLGLRKIAVADMNGHVAYQDKWYPLLNKSGIYWFRHGFYELFQSKATNKFLSGNFEAPNFFEEYRDILIEEFTPKYPPIEKNKEIYAAISSTNSVCITIRRGDYENDSEIKKLHSVCDKNYFQKAIEIMKEKVNEPVFFMFSDDIEWVKKNIDTGATTYYEDGDDPVWEKLRMMSSCKHFIISNSSFSWWSQWLSSNLGKIVISPSKWYNNDYMSPLIDESWIRI